MTQPPAGVLVGGRSTAKGWSVPKKTKHYEWVKFPEEAIREARRAFYESHGAESPTATGLRTVDISRNESWRFDTDEEFFAEYRCDIRSASYEREYGGFKVDYGPLGIQVTIVSVELTSRASVEGVFSVFERWVDQGRIQQPKVTPTVFIGHGHTDDWKELRDRLRDRHHLKVRAFESDPRAGQTVRQVLEDELDRSSFALLVHTGEDELRVGEVSARENVVHETGLFQGRLGFERAIILREDGCEAFSNVLGVQEIRYSRGHVAEAISDVLATLDREFPESQ